MVPRLGLCKGSKTSQHLKQKQICVPLPQLLEQFAGNVKPLDRDIAHVHRDDRERGLAVLGCSAKARACAEGCDAPLILLALKIRSMLVVMAPGSNVWLLNVVTGRL